MIRYAQEQSSLTGEIAAAARMQGCTALEVQLGVYTLEQRNVYWHRGFRAHRSSRQKQPPPASTVHGVAAGPRADPNLLGTAYWSPAVGGCPVFPPAGAASCRSERSTQNDGLFSAFEQADQIRIGVQDCCVSDWLRRRQAERGWQSRQRLHRVIPVRC